jgi:hypothetical protein
MYADDSNLQGPKNGRESWFPKDSEYQSRYFAADRTAIGTFVKARVLKAPKQAGKRHAKAPFRCRALGPAALAEDSG